MVCFQDFVGLFQILIIPGHLIPGQREKCLDITAHHTGLSLTAPSVFEALHFFYYLLFYFPGSLQLFCLLAELVRLRAGVVFPQFFPDHFELFPEDIFPLVLIHPFFYLALQLGTDLQNLYFIGEYDTQRFIAFFQCHSF